MSEGQVTLPLKAVMYADGGCRPSRGIGGFGYHGYIYLPTPQKTGSGCKAAQPTINGYLKEKTGAMDITPVMYLDGFGPLIPEVTNNYAELVAADQALQAAAKHQPSEVLMLLDSQYVIQGLTAWSESWEKNHWIRPDGNPVPNADQWKSLLTTKRLVEDNGIQIKWQWVKGHNGGEALGNDLADAHATRGVVQGRNLVHNHITKDQNRSVLKDTTAKGYWSSRIERNRLISHPRWYFTSTADGQVSNCGRAVYYFGSAGDEDDLLGRRSATATYSVLYLKTPDKHLDIIRLACQRMGLNHFQGPMRGYLDKIFSNDVLQELDEYGDITLIRDLDKQRLLNFNNVLLVEEIRPTRLAYRGFDRLNCLQQMLDAYITPKEDSKVVSTDITAQLYETVVSKKKTTVKLNTSFTNAVRSHKLPVNYRAADGSIRDTEISLSVGLDIPDRNTLSALAEDIPKIVVLTWPEAERAMRYATVVEVNGDIGIWSGIYANLHLLAS
jgi:ribonuclease HI